MKVVITGGSGFVGTHLSRHLLKSGHRVTALGSRATYDQIDHPEFTYVSADTTRPGSWQEAVAQGQWLFNLAGRTIFKRWSRSYKRQIYDSRILTTRNLVAALPDQTSAVLVSTSAVGYYGDRGDEELVESSPAGKDFLADLAKAWEAEAAAAESKGARVVIARFGIALGIDGGALAKMIPAFRSFTGGPLGSGKQWFPWIHIQDLVAALTFLSAGGSHRGAFNICAPHPVRNRQMAAALGKALGRPAAVAAPAFMLKMMMGEMAGVLLGSQRTLPAELQQAGFAFAFPRIDAALAHLIPGSKGEKG
ncbi:MAG: TIGR01777 family oxidoreductase [Desulfobacteraceae bacterium]